MPFPEAVVNLKLLKKAIGPRLTNLISLSFACFLLSALLITSKFISIQFLENKITECSLNVLIYFWLLGVSIVDICGGEYLYNHILGFFDQLHIFHLV